MLSADASVYLVTHFRKRRDELLKQRDINRQTVSRNIINFEDAEKVVGYLNMFQPDCDFISGLATAHAEAVQKAYELEGQPLTQRVIDEEIMPEVEKILMQSVGGVISREKGRMKLLQMRTRQVDSRISAKLGSLTRHLTKMVKETQQRIRNDATLHMLEMKKIGTGFQKTEAPVTDDYKFAKLALDEARKSVAEDDERPHPMVGAVVVKNGEVLAVAHRGEAPGNHAEFTALEMKLPKNALTGATVYTTLEPCTTRRPPKVPCTERLIERRVARVVIGMLDPDERITGRGVRRLTEANIIADLFPHALRLEVEELNREFTRHCKLPNAKSVDSSASSLSVLKFERRMKIYNATKEFIGLVAGEAAVKSREPLFKFAGDTQDHHLFFGPEIGEYIDELYKKGTRLHSMWLASGPAHVIRPDDIEEETKIQMWFTDQIDALKGKFLKYLDFRGP